ncbi:phospholipase A1 VesT1.02-like [Maniola jurtina]|uniref:phospholipase A1 VesT1.02-like n=1 Tax=Maniola jurtina TaxID=191418 RepID=UPI001E687F4C|nr:phospholipase A1 VesT1.02-like [Maniola jurtina]
MIVIQKDVVPVECTNMVMLLVVVLLLTSVASGLVTPVSNGLDQLVRAASSTCDILPLEVLFSWASTPELDVVEYTHQGKKSYRLNKAHYSLRNRLPSFLVIYIPGWWNTPTDESSDTLVKALLHKTPLILVLDTRATFCRGYVGSASRVSSVSQKIYKFIKNIYSDGYPTTSIHLIGFSLGAHVAGMTGKLVQSRLNQKIGKITALDPARPCFTQLPQYRLNKKDANFVQVIHTSAGILGLEHAIGHTDVYVNGVTSPQPECREKAVSLECDHAQSWKVFSASITNDRSLLGRQCKSWNELSNGWCSGNETMVGYGCNTKTRGMFLHKTQEVSRKIWVFNPFDIRTWWVS